MKKRLPIMIQEDEILDSFKMKKELNPEIWDKSGEGYVMKQEILKRLEEIAEEFLTFLGVEFFVHDITLTGSLANYNWSKFSDVDLHIVIDFSETEHDALLLKEFFDAKKTIWNSQHEIKVKGFDAELYVQDINERHESTGVYSVLHNKWILTPEPQKVKIDKALVKKKVEDWMNMIDDLEDHKDDPDILERVNKVREKLKNFRQAGLEEGGEYSYENLTFKYLRRNEYVAKLLDLKNEIIDKHLSLEQDVNIYKQ